MRSSYPELFKAIVTIFTLLTFSATAHASELSRSVPETIRELKALKNENLPAYRERIAEIKNQLSQNFEQLVKEDASSVARFRGEFRKQRAKYWRSKKEQFGDTFQSFLNLQRNVLYHQIEFLEFRKPEEYKTLIEEIRKARPSVLEELRARNEKFTRAKERLREREERIRELTQNREREQVAFQRRSDIVQKLRARQEDRRSQIMDQERRQTASTLEPLPPLPPKSSGVNVTKQNPK